MGRAFALILGSLLLLHGIVGLFIEGDHLVELFNVDIVMDAIYIGCGIALFATGLWIRSARILRSTLATVGGLLLIIGLLGLIDDTLWGAAPTGFTWFDFLLFFALGAISVLLAVLPRTAAPLETGGQPLTPGQGRAANDSSPLP